MRRNVFRYLVPYAHRNRRGCGLHPKKMSVGGTSGAEGVLTQMNVCRARRRQYGN